MEHVDYYSSLDEVVPKRTKVSFKNNNNLRTSFEVSSSDSFTSLQKVDKPNPRKELEEHCQDDSNSKFGLASSPQTIVKEGKPSRSRGSPNWCRSIDDGVEEEKIQAGAAMANQCVRHVQDIQYQASSSNHVKADALEGGAASNLDKRTKEFSTQNFRVLILDMANSRGAGVVRNQAEMPLDPVSGETMIQESNSRCLKSEGNMVDLLGISSSKGLGSDDPLPKSILKKHKRPRKKIFPSPNPHG
ncbi:hypothetical protein Nepgr_016447 [Nepenthes gracilis]|uniref:Uncharacterized protein n=1 Tax=Nepenthes gracilis TaxID=150966 RepID=A0AAD3SQC3_NEPGR|nr:hypothetical protein Nepgr_016447 [Nepenthes gracilis]